MNVLTYGLGFLLSENDDANFSLGKLCCIFPPWINSMGKNLSSSVIVKVAVIILLSFNLFIGTVIAPFGAKVLLDMDTNFEDVWSRLTPSDGGILFFWQYHAGIEFQALFGELQE